MLWSGRDGPITRARDTDARLVSDWTIRAAVPEDEDCIASMWLRQLCDGQDARACGMKGAREAGSVDQMDWWAENQPIVTALIRSATVLVACDAERPAYGDGEPAVIWAWAAVGDDVVYGFGLKRRLRVLGPDIARDLLGGRLGRPMRTVMDLRDLSRLGLVPSTWVRERGWASSLRTLSRYAIDGEQMHRRVAEHILDPQRKPWVPSERRAA